MGIPDGFVIEEAIFGMDVEILFGVDTFAAFSVSGQAGVAALQGEVGDDSVDPASLVVLLGALFSSAEDSEVFSGKW